MRHILFLLFGLLLFVSCGSENNEEPDPVVEVQSLKFVSVDPATTTELTPGSQSFILTFDRNITFVSSKAAQITLNGQSVKEAKVDGGVSPRLAVTAIIDANAEKVELTIPADLITSAEGGKNEKVALTWKVKQPDPIDTSMIDDLTNPNATEAAKKVYAFLKEQYGLKQLSGVQSSASNTLDFVNAVATATGKHPALAGFDFIYLAFSPTPSSWSWQQNYNDISAAKEQWENNGLVSYMWHWNVPNSEEDFNNCVNKGSTDNLGFYCPGANKGNGETSFDIREALKEGTWQNKCILRDIEEVAGYLKNLQDAGIPVIFRPLHEAAGNYTRYNKEGGAWFWWGRYGANYCKQLYQLLYTKLVNEYKLNNLIWVWTIDCAEGYETAAKEWYPGDNYVDIVGVDIYTDKNADCQSSQFHFMNTITGGKKLTTISECGNICDPTAQFTGGANWSWFMVWPTSDSNGNITIDGYKSNTSSYWTSTLSSPYILNREDMPSLK